MKRKNTTAALACILLLAMVLSACGMPFSKDVPAEASPSPTPDATVVIEPTGMDVSAWEGVYTEEIAHRGVLTVKSAGDQSASFSIVWPGSAFSRACVDMTGTFDAAKNAFVYTDGVWIDKTFDEQGNETDTVVYTRGTGSFQLGDKKLIWIDDTDPSRGGTFGYEMSLAEYAQQQAAQDPAVTPAIVPAPTDAPAPSIVPAPTATPAPSTTPAPGALPVVKKDPTSETVVVGGNCMFIAKYENAIWAVWHFVSPDGQTDMTYEAAEKYFPELDVVNGMYSTMTLKNCPIELNGWSVYCRYSNDAGYVDTKRAVITVLKGDEPTPTPTPAPAPTETPAPTAAPVVNQWVDTTDLDEAIRGSGVSFTPPISEALPDLLTLKGYRYMTGIIQADYYDRNGQTVLTIRKSNTTSGADLAGDFNSYSKVWDLTLKGLTVHCVGDGEKANTVTFGTGDHYSICYNIGQEGYGLTADQINSLINCIQ